MVTEYEGPNANIQTYTQKVSIKGVLNEGSV